MSEIKKYPVTRTMLLIKANKFAERFGENSLVFSNKWLYRIKKERIECTKPKIFCGKITGEATSFCTSDVEKWKSEAWADAIQDYEENVRLIAEGAGLICNMTPDQTFKFKGEKFSKWNLLEVRVTLLVCANMNGSESEN